MGDFCVWRWLRIIFWQKRCNQVHTKNLVKNHDDITIIV